MRFKHDCGHCKPLGEFDEADLYFCNTPWIGVTVVARYSDEESDYVSGMELAKYQTDLKEARKRAIECGLLVRPNVKLTGSPAVGRVRAERRVGGDE